MHELRGEDEPSLQELLKQIAPVDLVLIEGYKRDTHPKIEAHRKETGQDLIAPGDPSILAIASNVAHPEVQVPTLDLDDTKGLADFILQQVGL
jgi:molybdopterin-guanine dinucleotide biosynthesis protein MobB